MKTRSTLCLSLILLSSCAASAQTAAPCGGAQRTLSINWYQGNFDPCLTGNNSYETKLSTSTVGNLALYWHAVASWSISAPVVVNGTVYVYNRIGKLEARNATNGNSLWQYPVAPTSDDFYLASPAVANGIVYIGDGAGVLWAVKASDGTFVWKYATNSQYTMAPTVSNGVVYVTENPSTPSYTYALDAATGSLLWKYQVGYSEGVKPAVSGNRVYTGGDLGLVALDAKAGTPVWKGHPLGSPLDLAVHDGRVYVEYELLGLYALNAATGAVLWTSNEGPALAMALANGHFYGEMGNGAMFALDAYTGSLLWKIMGTDQSTQWGMAVANGIIYTNICFSASDCSIIARGGDTGAILWNYETGPGDFLTGPAVVNGTLYATRYGDLFVFHLPNQ